LIADWLSDREAIGILPEEEKTKNNGKKLAARRLQSFVFTLVIFERLRYLIAGKKQKHVFGKGWRFTVFPIQDEKQIGNMVK